MKADEEAAGIDSLTQCDSFENETMVYQGARKSALCQIAKMI
jgi:hypothetical protein